MDSPFKASPSLSSPSSSSSSSSSSTFSFSSSPTSSCSSPSPRGDTPPSAGASDLSSRGRFSRVPTLTGSFTAGSVVRGGGSSKSGEGGDAKLDAGKEASTAFSSPSDCRRSRFLVPFPSPSPPCSPESVVMRVLRRDCILTALLSLSLSLSFLFVFLKNN